MAELKFADPKNDNLLTRKMMWLSRKFLVMRTKKKSAVLLA